MTGGKNIRRAKFYPINPLDGKRNLKRIARADQDGSIIERVYLDVADLRHREHLICLHYFRHLTRHFLRDYIYINIIGRDNPWDFKIDLNNGCIFNIEIVSIADNAKHFEKNKREERLKRWNIEETIPLHELIKLLTIFPDEHITSLVNEYKCKNSPLNALVPNPYYSQSGQIFISTLYESEEKLDVLLKRAITKKAEKNHNEKENTVLIIDNRTGAFDVPDYFEACESIFPFVTELPFPEIWFYTGYYSNDDGNQAEFSFAPIKVTPEQNAILGEMAKSNNTDSFGRYVW